jgi:hypothetical protein
MKEVKMEEILKREISSGLIPNSASSKGIEEKLELRPNGSHRVTLDRPFGAEVEEEKSSEQKDINFHLTVRLKVNLTDRQCSLLLDVLNYQAVRFGITFNLYLAMLTLYLRLCKNRRASECTSDFSVVTVNVTEIILRCLKDQLISLDPGQFVHLPEKLKAILSEGLMTKRTYGSRYISWRPEFFLQVLTVPVDAFFLNPERNSSPYISYCKGYGESHPNAHRHKTKFSSELDVDVLKEEWLEECELLFRSVHPKHKLSEVLRYEYDEFIKGNI